jgi:hypothetical protein
MKNLVDNIIKEAIQKYDGSYTLNNPFEEMLSFGELVDRLSIVNFKLFTLKDEVMRRTEDNDFKSWASVEDVKLVKERSRLKRCIDEKMVAMIARISKGDATGGFNPEVKKYGDEV